MESSGFNGASTASAYIIHIWNIALDSVDIFNFPRRTLASYDDYGISISIECIAWDLFRFSRASDAVLHIPLLFNYTCCLWWGIYRLWIGTFYNLGRKSSSTKSKATGIETGRTKKNKGSYQSTPNISYYSYFLFHIHFQSWRSFTGRRSRKEYSSTCVNRFHQDSTNLYFFLLVKYLVPALLSALLVEPFNYYVR